MKEKWAERWARYSAAKPPEWHEERRYLELKRALQKRIVRKRQRIERLEKELGIHAKEV